MSEILRLDNRECPKKDYRVIKLTSFLWQDSVFGIDNVASASLTGENGMPLDVIFSILILKR